MVKASSMAFFQGVWLSTLVVLTACSSDSAPSNAGNAGAGQASAGSPSAGDSGSSGADSSAGDAAGGSPSSAGRNQGGSPNAGAAGAPAHGGAPVVDYGNPEVPPAEWTNVTGMFAGMQSECGNMSGMFSSPFLDLLVLGVARQGLWSSTDGGASYEKLGMSGDPFLGRLTTVAWDPSSSQVFYVSGIYGWESPFTDGVFKTTNAGASLSGYKALSAIQSHNDSVSVDFSDPERKTLLSGGHEQAKILFLSTDAGVSWSDIGPSLPDDVGFCTTTLVLDSKHLLVGCAASYSGKSGAILRSTAGGDSWTKVATQGVVGQPLWALDGSIYWAAEAGGLLKSTDQGSSFAQVSDQPSNRVSPIQLPDGRIASLVDKALALSDDGGETWQGVGSAVPFDPNSICYSPFRRAFFATHFDCTDAVPADAIARYGFDFKQ
jgi:hypothetical protein